MRSWQTQARMFNVMHHAGARTLVKRQVTLRLDRLHSNCLACTFGIVLP